MKKVNDYVDICLIDEYATKDFQDGYSLDLDSLPEHEKSNFLDVLMENDTSVRDFVLSHMQEIITRRLPECESQDKRHAGLTTRYLSNGESYLEGTSQW